LEDSSRLHTGSRRFALDGKVLRAVTLGKLQHVDPRGLTPGNQGCGASNLADVSGPRRAICGLRLLCPNHKAAADQQREEQEKDDPFHEADPKRKCPATFRQPGEPENEPDGSNDSYD